MTVPPRMTDAEHARQVSDVRLSLMLAPTRADRRDGPLRRPRPLLPGPHVFEMPVVHEIPCSERRPL